MPIGSPQWMYKSGEAYTIDQSLKFESSRSTYLSRTPTSAGNQKTWTWSGWVKKMPPTRDIIMSTSNGGTSFFSFGWTSGGGNQDKFYLYWYDGSTDYGYHTTSLFRDHSAFYHIVIAVDTTQGTEANRVKVYFNGIQETLVATYAAFPQDHDTYYNDNNAHYIGYNTDSSDTRLNGYLAEVHSIDGTALTPSSFGETGDYGEWKPIEVSGLTYGTNGFYLSFAGGGVMSATGGTITTDGDYKVHSFTSDGTFTPTSISNGGEVEYLVIGGGGSGGSEISGGGGAGGYRTGYLAVTKQAYSITVGDGGVAPSSSAGTDAGNNGEDSVFASITSVGGGGGGGPSGSYGAGRVGGSGGGGKIPSGGTGAAGTSGQGNAGGSAGGGYPSGGGGGGGSGGAGGNGSGSGAGAGGAGTASSITGASVTRAGGGGGGTWNSSGQFAGGAGGSGGGQAGWGNQASGYTSNEATGNQLNDGTITSATANTGSGGGGGGNGAGYGGNGASGIVIIRYKFQ